MTRKPTSDGRADALAYVPKVGYTCGPMALHVAMRVTAHAVVQWAASYEVQPTQHFSSAGVATPREGRAGALPADPLAKHVELERVFGWLEQTRGPAAGGVSLRADGAPLLAVDGGT